MQSGFGAGPRCTSATLKVLNDIITAIDKRQYCAAVFIALAKAFNSVNHHILIGSLNSLGFSNDCLAWFTNYFADRVQCDKSEGLLSRPLAVSMWIHLVSILEPTLFSVHIYDVALAAGDSLIHLYADDTILYTSGPSLDTVLKPLWGRWRPTWPTSSEIAERKIQNTNFVILNIHENTSVQCIYKIHHKW